MNSLDAQDRHTAFVAALAVWDAHDSEANLKPSTRYSYRCIAGRFLRWLEPQRLGLGEVTVPTVEQYLASVSLLPASQKLYRHALRVFFDALVSCGLIMNNPVVGAELRPAKPETPASEQPMTMENLPDQFAAFSTIEKQATVDAASFAVLFHDIWCFTEGQGGARADVTLCEAVLELGERYAITPFSFLEGETPVEGTQDGQEAGSGAQSEPAMNEEGEIHA